MSEVRQVVAWLRPVQVLTCAALWAVFGAATLLPDLHLPLREIAPFGFAAALLRTIVLVLVPDSSAGTAMRGLALCADAVLLTGLLDITGGPFNPFVVIYAVDVWVAAVTLSAPWAGMVIAVSASTFGWLVADHLQAGLAEHHRLSDFPTHLFTMWFTASTIVELVAHYVAQARQVLAVQQRALDGARERAARSERLAALTTLAAGAAHELSTPLSTIAVAARELERAAAERAATATSLIEDVHLIRDAVERCRSILDGMSGRASGDALTQAPMTPLTIAERACAALPVERRERLTVEVSPQIVRIGAGADVARALSSLLKNAFDADAAQPVILRAHADDRVLHFEVHDHGPGMSEEMQNRVGEPFFTTKKPGEGLGLGVFLARTIAEQLGGSLRFEQHRGTVAILEIPLSEAAV